MMEAALRILLVEDNPMLRLDASVVLSAAGYDVLEASNGDQAIALLETRSDICVMVSDIQMPGSLDGVELAHTVRRRWPPIEVLLTSGRRSPSADELPKGVRYLAKPFAATELLAKVGQLAAAHEPIPPRASAGPAVLRPPTSRPA